MSETVTVIRGLKRLKNSKLGNPRWEVATDHGHYRTMSDSQVGYFLSDSVIGKRVTIDVVGVAIVSVKVL